MYIYEGIAEFNELFKRVNTSEYPSTNIQETSEAFVVHLVVPGISKEKLAVSIEKDFLIVSYDHDESEIQYTLQEWVPKTFKRRFKLPSSIDGNKVSAVVDLGVLTITLSKKEVDIMKQVIIE